MMVNNNNYIQNSGDNKSYQSELLRAGFLSLVTLVLSGSLFLLAPIPLLFSFLLYGMAKSFIASGVFVTVALGMSQVGGNFEFLLGYGLQMILATLFSFAAFYVIVSGNNPAREFLKRGVGLAVLLTVLMVGTELVAGKSFLVDYFNELEVVTLQPFEAMKADARVHEQIVAAKAEFESLKQMRFAVMFLIFSAIMWLSLYVALRNKRVWSGDRNYRFTRLDLVNFKVPEYGAYIVVAGLALFLIADSFQYAFVKTASLNVLLCMGGLYFLQGMSIYLAFLSYLKIFGFLRSFLTILTIFSANKIIAVVGLLDLWLNFRKYFKKNEGDIS